MKNRYINKSSAKLLLGTFFLTTAAWGSADPVPRLLEEHATPYVMQLPDHNAKGKDSVTGMLDTQFYSNEGSNPNDPKSVSYDRLNCPRAIQTIVDKNFDGSEITIFDDSLWSVYYYDKHITIDWQKGDEVILTLNETSPFDYKFEMYNRSVDQKVRVRMIDGPLVQYARQLVEYDRFSGNMRLSDGTFWDISVYSSALAKSWYKGTAVIVGGNNQSDRDFRPYILIDVKTNTYVKARSIN